MNSLSNLKNIVKRFKPHCSFHVFEKGQNIYKVIASNTNRWFIYEGPVNNKKEYLPHGRGKVLEYVSENKRVWLEGNFKYGRKHGIWGVMIDNFWYNVEFELDKLTKIIRRFDKYGNYYEGNYNLNTLNLEGDAILYKNKQNKYLKVFCENNKIKKIFCYSFDNNVYIGQFNKNFEAHGLGIFYHNKKNKIYIGNFINDEIFSISHCEIMTEEEDGNEFNIFKLIMQYYFYRDETYRNLILDILYIDKFFVLKKLDSLQLFLEEKIFTSESNFINFINDLNLEELLDNYLEQERNKKKRKRKSNLRNYYIPETDPQKENSAKNNLVL